MSLSPWSCGGTHAVEMVAQIHSAGATATDYGEVIFCIQTLGLVSIWVFGRVAIERFFGNVDGLGKRNVRRQSRNQLF